MKPLFLFILSFILFSVSCKKDKDIITPQTINGMVYNNCTDSGLAGVTVYLKIIKDNSSFKSYQMVSGSNGNFTFNNVEIHSSSKYSYAIFIPSKSGDGATTAEYCGFVGTTMSFSKDEAGVFLKPRVTPGYLYFNVYCQPLITTNTSDSIKFYCTQKTFHVNKPQEVYYWGGGGYGSGSSPNNSGGYPMGKYNISIEIWRSGINSTKQDSVYLNWAANRTYTINW